ncbi:MAG TPA: ABC transporter permease [Clostridiales bacterium]|nr:ABC transporter permease [Clostridiales bacterium]
MVIYLMSAISISTVFLFGCIGEIITEKSGHLNLGIPGIMCMGTFGGCFGMSIYMNALASQEDAVWLLLVLISIFFAMLFAACGGAIYAFLTVTLRCNQNITGLALTTFGSGFTDYFMKTINMDRSAWASKVMRYSLPFADKLGWFGEIFLSHGILVYLAIAVAIAVSIVFKRTRIGLNLRAVGENPATADAAGVNVNAYKYGAILIGSAIAGIGGLFYVMDYVAGSWQNSSTIEAFGWLAIALVIFAVWKPDLAILGSFVFGLFFVLTSYSEVAFGIHFSLAQKELVRLAPYMVAIIVLIVTSIIGKKETQPPAALGTNYFREER